MKKYQHVQFSSFIYLNSKQNFQKFIQLKRLYIVFERSDVYDMARILV